jgi:3-hydroxyisobutyrate dehydrogenase
VRIAIVGCGEVGRAYAAAAGAEGHELVLIDPRPAPAVHALVAELGATLVMSPVADDLAGVERVWLCVTGELTRRVVVGLLDRLPTGAVIVDLTTASASDKRACADLAADGRVTYVDAVIMGAVAVTGARTPMLGAGPAAATALEDFRALGAPVDVLAEARPGDAATIKLLRTILTKGLESLAVECLMAAEREGLRTRLYDVLGDVDSMGFAPFLDMLVRTHVQHAGRRLQEVERAQAQLAELGSPSLVLLGTQSRFERTVAALVDNPPEADADDNVDSALQWLLSSTEDRRGLPAAPVASAGTASIGVS